MLDLPDTPSVTASRPDTNTSEAILYGSKYLFQKSSAWYWDAVEDELKKEIEADLRKIRDKEFASFVLNHRRDMIFSRNAPTSDVNKIKDLRVLKEVVKHGTALRNLELRRKNNEMYSRMHGISEYTEQMMRGGISDRMWKVSTIAKNSPINYDTVRALIEEDQAQTEKDAKEYQKKVDEYQAEIALAKAQEEAYRKSIGGGTDDSMDKVLEEDNPEFDLENITIYKVEDAGDRVDTEGDRTVEEVEEVVDPNDDEFWEDAEEERVVVCSGLLLPRLYARVRAHTYACERDYMRTLAEATV